ncbi:MAG: nucleotidyltransferase domain-containing protein [Clostridia bacterium]|nr:nucleotidyltransferase domain-containing protein [Clostridia bacterium]
MCDKIYTIDDIRKTLYPVFSAYNIKKAVLFGSYVKGRATEHSDIDLLLDSGLRGLQFVGLIEAVRGALDKDVDVFDETHIIPNSKIFSEINKDGIVIYER